MTRTIKGIALFGLVATLSGLTASVAAQPQMSKDKPADTAKDAKQVELGEKVPDFELPDLDGKMHKLSDFKDKNVVLEWTNPDCPYIVGVYKTGVVASTVSKLKEMGDNYVYIAINSTANMPKDDVISRERAFLKEHNLDIPVLIDYDGKVGKMFGAKHTPDIYVLDNTHTLRYFGGYTDDHQFKNGTDSTNYAINALTQLKNRESVSPDTARRWGCSVKYAPKSSS